jgi:RES domain-containing protein
MRTPIITSINGPFFRIYREKHKSPMFFGKTLDFRFDSANGDCGVLYASPVLAGAFVETFMQELGRTSVSIKELRQRPVALIHPRRPLRFIDLFAKGGQMRLGLDGRICTGSYAVAQAWSDALRRHPEKPDGILFPSRHELSLPSCAIFETVESELRWERWGSLDEPKFAHELSTLLAMGVIGLDP